MKKYFVTLLIYLIVWYPVLCFSVEQELVQSTTTSIVVGPFFDDTDFKTLEPGIDVTSLDVAIIKPDLSVTKITPTASGGNNDMAYLPLSGGSYSFELTVGNTDTLGVFTIVVDASAAGALPTFQTFRVVSQDSYDSGHSINFENFRSGVIYSPTTDSVTVGTNSDKTGYSISGAITTLDGLNNFDPTLTGVFLTDAAYNQVQLDNAENLASVTSTIQDASVSIEADIAGLNNFDPGSSGVFLTNAAYAQVQLDGAENLNSITATINNIDTNVLALNDFDPATDQVDVGTIEGNTITNDFYRIPAWIVFSPTTDSVTVGTNNDKTGYGLSNTALANIQLDLAESIASITPSISALPTAQNVTDTMQQVTQQRILAVSDEFGSVGGGGATYNEVSQIVADRLNDATGYLPGTNADQVWEEAIADHSGTSGSTAETLNGAGGGSSPSQVAGAVLASPTTVGSASKTHGSMIRDIYMMLLGGGR